MRWHLRVVTLGLISLLSLSQGASVLCEAMCGPDRVSEVLASDSACHFSNAPGADAPQIEGVEASSCDHDVAIYVMSPPGQQVAASYRQTRIATLFADAAPPLEWRLILASSVHRPPDTPVVPVGLPLRI
jgi:hypothetical protein